MTTMMRTLLVRVAACVLGVMAMVATAHASDGSSTAEADNNAGGIPDVWEMDGARFDLAALKLEVFAAPIASVGGSSLRLKLGGGLPCKTMAGQPAHQRHFSDDSATAACMLVPGVPPNVAASTAGARISLLDAGNPGIGFVVSLQGGDHCEVVKRGRKLDARFLCDPTGARRSVTAWEGQGMNVCHYVMEIRTQQACPAHTTSARPVEPLLSGVSGCASDTDTSTSGCKQGMTLVVHGRGFQHNVAAADVLIGDATCLNTRIMSNWQLTCTLPDVPSLHPTLEVRLHHADGEPTVLRVENAVTYAPSPQRLHHQFQTFEDLGVGGLNKEISEIYRRVFQSRALPSNIVSALGIKHIKGILLYGPPGSGKTLVARTIAKLLGSDNVQLINTPDIMQKYLGESEKQLRQFFDKAQSTSEDDVHFIIFDELDAIFRERGRGDGSAASMAYDSVVNALLTQMDGLNEINNVIVFGMTNRRELIDPALLRPGRFEVQVEIGLPDFDGRSAILRIHTEEMKENSLLDDGVDLDEIARRTSRYSGAELAGIVRNAASLAVSRVMDRTLDASSFSTEDMANMKINMEDFMTALRELKPAYTDHFDNVNTFYFPHGFLPLSLQHENAHELCVSAITQARLPGATARRILLFGPPGTGKTTLAVHAALASSPDYLKVIRASDLVELTDAHKSQRIAAAFRDAEKAKHAVVVLDDLERLAEIVSTNHLQGSFSHAVVHTLLTSLTSISPASSMIVLATTRHDPRETSFASNALQFQQTFDTTVRVPALTPSDIRSTALALDCDLSHVRFAAAARMPVRSLLQVVHTLRATTSNATIVIDQATFDSHMLEFGFEDHAHAHTAAPAPE